MRNMVVGMLIGAVLAVLVVVAGGTFVRAQGIKPEYVGHYQLAANGTVMIDTVTGELFRLREQLPMGQWVQIASSR
jgi:hypothetical protein